MKIRLSALQEVKFELNSMHEYDVFLEKFLVEKDEKFRKWVDEEASRLGNDEDEEEFIRYYNDLYWERAYDFSNTLRGSLFVLTMSFLEYQLAKLCGDLHKVNKFDRTLRDVKVKGAINRAVFYLKNVAGVHFPDDAKCWKNILVYRIIRNAIVHNNSYIKDRDIDKVMPYLVRNNFINLHSRSSGYMVFLRDTFCPEVINNIKEFLEELYSNLEKQI